MPESREYLNAYGFVVGYRHGGWVITKSAAGHESIVRYNEYRYPTQLQLVMDRDISEYDIDNIMNVITDHLNTPLIVYSASGRPYKCTASDIKLTERGSNYINLSYVGYGKRVSQAEADMILS